MRRSALFLALVLCSCSTESPGDGAGGEGGGAGKDEDPCCILGAVCHMAGEAPEDVDECHRIGHSGDEAMCSEEYDRCRLVCEGVTDNPVPHACQ